MIMILPLSLFCHDQWYHHHHQSSWSCAVANIAIIAIVMIMMLPLSLLWSIYHHCYSSWSCTVANIAIIAIVMIMILPLSLLWSIYHHCYCHDHDIAIVIVPSSCQNCGQCDDREEQACEKMASHTYNYDTVHGHLHDDVQDAHGDDDDDGHSQCKTVTMWIIILGPRCFMNNILTHIFRHASVSSTYPCQM